MPDSVIHNSKILKIVDHKRKVKKDGQERMDTCCIWHSVSVYNIQYKIYNIQYASRFGFISAWINF